MTTPYYKDDLITIYHGDCADIVPELGRFDLLLTDPPYGMGEAAGKNISRGKLATAKDYGSSNWDNKPIKQEIIDALVRVAKHSIIFGGNYYAMPPSSAWIVWDKQINGDFADCELAWTNLGSAVRIFRFMWNGMLRAEPGERWHPTQKPRSLMEFCIQQAEKKGVVTSILDPFMGSGTTLVAARRNAIRAVGIDLEEKYCEIAARRVQQLSLFEAEGAGIK